MKLPAIQFYTSDWLLDHAVQRLTSSGRGIWINLLCHMSENSKRGYITGSVDQLARWGGVSIEEFMAFIDCLSTPLSPSIKPLSLCELIEHSNGDITLINRRMVRDEKARRNNAKRQRDFRSRHKESVTVTAGVTAMLYPSSSSSSSSIKDTTRSADNDGFAEFWTAYPKKVGKVVAGKAWRKLKPDTSLIAMILADLKTRAWPADRQFVPYASTYLNGRRWEDETPKPAAVHSSLPDADDVLRAKGLLS
jgi:hypothetical protein